MKNALIFLLALLLSVAVWWILSNPPKKESTVERQARETVKLEVERVTKKVDDMGFEHATVDEAKQTLTQAGVVSDSTMLRRVDSLVELVGIQRNQIRSYGQVVAQLGDSLLAAKQTPTGYSYMDKWVTLSLTNPSATDSAKFGFSYNAEFNWLEYEKRKGLFGERKKYLDVWLSDTRATINGVKRLVIEPEQKDWGVALMAIGEYQRDEMLVGSGISVDIGRFRVQGNYLYSPVDNRWYPGFRGGFKIIDIK